MIFFPKAGSICIYQYLALPYILQKELSVNWSVFLHQGGQWVHCFYVGIHARQLPFSLVGEGINCGDFFPKAGSICIYQYLAQPCILQRELSVNWSVFLRQGSQSMRGFHVGIHACLLPFSFVASCALDCIIWGCFCWCGRRHPCAHLNACVGVFSFVHSLSVWC